MSSLTSPYGLMLMLCYLYCHIFIYI